MNASLARAVALGISHFQWSDSSSGIGLSMDGTGLQGLAEGCHVGSLIYSIVQSRSYILPPSVISLFRSKMGVV